MRVSRELFEHKNYPEKFPEFKRLMAFCEVVSRVFRKNSLFQHQI